MRYPSLAQAIQDLACSVRQDVPWLARARAEIPISPEEYERMRASGLPKPLLEKNAWILYTLNGLPVCFVKGGPAGSFPVFP